MKFKEYYSSLSKNDKELLAGSLKTTVPYLSQLANGHRNPGSKFLLGIEKASFGHVTYMEFSEAM